VKNIKSILFICVLALICVLLLTFAYQYSRPIIEKNEKLDVITAVLETFDIRVDASIPDNMLIKIFNIKVKEKTVEGLPYYEYGRGRKKLYCFPVVAKGLWGMIYGFISFKRDLKTINGITFNKHQETPGLGARIDEEQYRKNYSGLKILSKKGKFGLISQKKGKKKMQNSVDAITGATLTSDGVVAGINDSVQKYINLLKRK